MSTHKSTWKNFERTVAAFFNSHRTPFSGMLPYGTKSDIEHDVFFVECKYRVSFPVYKKYEEFKGIKVPGMVKSSDLIPKVLDITNMRKYSRGQLWLFSYEDAVKISHAASLVCDTEGKPRIIILKRKLAVKRAKADMLVTLYREIRVKAETENKVPIVAIKQKNKQGWLMAVDPIYLNNIKIISENG